MVKAYTQNLYASEVYRELERQAVRKGHFDPTPEELVRSAAYQITQQRKINHPVSVSPSDDLIQDVARLAYAMRRKGYITQAEDLEQKLVIYKQAESSLYDVTSEKAQDYIDMAHTDGDYQVQGFGELGVVETVESAAAKIRAVVQKEPTGKLAALAAEIVKEGRTRRRGGGVQPGESARPEEASGRIPETTFETAKAEWVRAKDTAPVLGKVTFEGTNAKDPAIQAVYARYSQVPVENIQRYFQVKDILAGSGLLNPDGSLNTTKFTPGSVTSNPAWVVAAQRAAQALGLTEDYFSGVSGISSADKTFGVGSARQWPGGQNANSIYLEDLTWGGDTVNQRYVGSTTNIGKLAGQLTTQWNAVRAAAWGVGDQLWKTTGDRIRAEAEGIITTIKGIDIDDAGVVRAGVLDVSKGTAAIRNAGKAVQDEYVKYKDTLVALNTIAQEEKKKLDGWIAGINAATESALTKLVEGDAIWGQNVVVGDLVSSLESVKDKMNQIIAKDDASTRNRQAAQTNRDEIQRLINTLSKFTEGGRWVSIEPMLQQFDLGNPGSWSDAQAAIKRNYISAADRWADGILGAKGGK